jgi:hypothetical protein
MPGEFIVNVYYLGQEEELAARKSALISKSSKVRSIDSLPGPQRPVISPWTIISSGARASGGVDLCPESNEDSLDRVFFSFSYTGKGGWAVKTGNRPIEENKIKQICTVERRMLQTLTRS